VDLRLVSPPAVEPLSLQEAKDHLRVTHAAEDALIQAYITAARSRCEEYQRRAYVQQTWELSLDGFPCASANDPHAVIRLPRPPVQSVASVIYVAEDGSEVTMDASAYQLDAGGELARLSPAYGTTWPRARRVPGAVRIRYVAGYPVGGTEAQPDPAANVPPLVRMAMRFEIGHYYANREAVVTGTIVTSMHSATKDLLSPGRAPVFYP
jgi:uncharacterized phiE125 gp8 family phage protein